MLSWRCRRVTGTAETFGPQEEREISDFLDAIIATQPMEYVHKVGVARFTFGQQMKALSYSEDFFDICHDQSRSACMVDARPTFSMVLQWLSSRNLMAPGQQQWKAALHQMWFALYRREVQNDSSGFEHVFLGESDEGQVKVTSLAQAR